MNNRWCNATGHCTPRLYSYVLLLNYCASRDTPELQPSSSLIKGGFCSHDLISWNYSKCVHQKRSVQAINPNPIPICSETVSILPMIMKGENLQTRSSITMDGEGAGGDPLMLQRRAEMIDAYTQLLRAPSTAPRNS